MAIVTNSVPDPSVVQGAILANIPIACEPKADLATLIANGDHVRVEVNGEGGMIRFG